jgi:hypothetical protein
MGGGTVYGFTAETQRAQRKNIYHRKGKGRKDRTGIKTRQAVADFISPQRIIVFRMHRRANKRPGFVFCNSSFLAYFAPLR